MFRRASILIALVALLSTLDFHARAAEAPLPRPKPTEIAEDEATEKEPTEDEEAAEDAEPPEPAEPQKTVLPPVDEEAIAECERQLRELGAEFERLPPIEGYDGCGVNAPYNVEVVAPGVSLNPSSQVTCETALALSRWISLSVMPAASALGPGVRLTRIDHGSTYICRNRNSSTNGKLSEHAVGRAIDIMSFRFDGHDTMPVVPRAGDGNLRESFQRAVRGGACLYFTTVLGPGTDEAHNNHLHLDILPRNRGYRLCQ